jgi:raffinose/stachyose/melibiose transport system permease protein
VKKTKRRSPLAVLAYLFVIAGSLIIAFPLYITFVTAFKTLDESAVSFFTLPTRLYLGNFAEVVSDEYFWNYIINSIGVTVGAVGIIAVFIPMVSYAISRNMQQKRYYRFLYIYFILGVFVPFQVFMVPLTQMMTKFHMLNQVGLVLCYVAFGLCEGVFLYVGYLKSVPLEIEEASAIDGCSTVQTFFRIIYPISKPMTATVVILDTLWVWNDFLLPVLMLNRSPKNWTLPLYQYNFKSAHMFRYNLAFAAFLFSIIPMIVLYAFLQRYIIEGLTAGAVKT